MKKNIQLIISVAVISSISTVAFLYISKKISRYFRIKRVKKETSIDWQATPDYESVEYQQLVSEQLSRNALLLGEEGMQKLKTSLVIVVGLGGVGSHAAHMLARAGVSRLRLIDFDQVTLSSLNRHAVATRKDVGIAKVVATKNHLLEVVPHAEIDAVTRLFCLKDAPELLGGNPDFVLDCIDNLETKCELIAYCAANDIKIIASMGAGAKCDPSRIQIGDINETSEDPLAKQVRITLRRNGFDAQVPCVFSTEKPGSVALAALDKDKFANAQEFAPLPNFRARILPVLGTLPALFGNAQATFVITELAGFPLAPIPQKLTKRNRERLWRDLYLREGSLLQRTRKKLGLGQEILLDGEEAAGVPTMYVTSADCGFIFEETWRARSALGGTVSNSLMLVRWHPALPAKLGNIICLSKTEANKHEKLATFEKVVEYYPTEFLQYVASRFEMEGAIHKIRIS